MTNKKVIISWLHQLSIVGNQKLWWNEHGVFLNVKGACRTRVLFKISKSPPTFQVHFSITL
jgi:hypothetical protein